MSISNCKYSLNDKVTVIENKSRRMCVVPLPSFVLFSKSSAAAQTSGLKQPEHAGPGKQY
jgi:hypothetical protein